MSLVRFFILSTFTSIGTNGIHAVIVFLDVTHTIAGNREKGHRPSCLILTLVNVNTLAVNFFKPHVASFSCNLFFGVT